VTLELVVLAPAVLLLIGLAVAGGRVVLGDAAVDQAAAAAAREASLARDPATAVARAEAAVAVSLDRQDLHCHSTSVDVDVADFARPVGQPGSVTATVTCYVPLGDLFVPGLPGSRRLEATATSPLDRYRAR
jgi:Flp pilus assembly protein TadG